jgi:hypothetical protein
MPQHQKNCEIGPPDVQKERTGFLVIGDKTCFFLGSSQRQRPSCLLHPGTHYGLGRACNMNVWARDRLEQKHWSSSCGYGIEGVFDACRRRYSNEIVFSLVDVTTWEPPRIFRFVFLHSVLYWHKGYSVFSSDCRLPMIWSALLRC